MAFSDTIGLPNYLDTLLPIPVSRSGKAFLFLLVLPIVIGLLMSSMRDLAFDLFKFGVLGLSLSVLLIFFKFIR